MEWAVGERVEPLRSDDEISFPYCAAQRNLDKVDIRTGRSVPVEAGTPRRTALPGGVAKGTRALRYPRGECRG